MRAAHHGSHMLLLIKSKLNTHKYKSHKYVTAPGCPGRPESPARPFRPGLPEVPIRPTSPGNPLNPLVPANGKITCVR